VVLLVPQHGRTVPITGLYHCTALNNNLRSIVMQQPTEYYIESGNNSSELEASVQKAINDGYVPFGTPFTSIEFDNEDFLMFFQAVIRYADKA